MLKPSNQQSISTVPEETAFDPGNQPDNVIRPQSSMTDLMMLRAQFPFTEIMPFPTKSINLKLALGIPIQANIPSGTKLMRFTGSGNFWVSTKGNASFPALAPTTGQVGDDNSDGSLYRPDRNYFYVTGKGQVSIISDTADVQVSIDCWIIEMDTAL